MYRFNRPTHKGAMGRSGRRFPDWCLIFEGNESDDQTLNLVRYDGEVYQDFRNIPVRIPRLLSERPFEHWTTVPIAERRETELFERKMAEFRKSQTAREVFGMGHDVFATVRFGRFYTGFTSNPVPENMPMCELSRKITSPPPSIKKSFRPSDCELDKLDAFLISEGFEEYGKNYKYLCTLKDGRRSKEVEFDHNLERCIDHTREKLLIFDLVRLQSSDFERGKPSKPDIRILIRSSSNLKPKFDKSAIIQPILAFEPDEDLSTDQASADAFRKIILNENYEEAQGEVEYVRQKLAKNYRIKKTASSPTSEFGSKVVVNVTIVKNYEAKLDGLVSTGILENEVTVTFPSLPEPEYEAEWKEISFALLEFSFKLGDVLRIVWQSETPQLQP